MKLKYLKIIFKLFKNNKNEIMFHDKDKIYINKKFLEDNFLKLMKICFLKISCIY